MILIRLFVLGWAALVLVGFCFVGCAGTVAPRNLVIEPLVHKVWPEPPLPPRIRYLTSYSGPEWFLKQEGRARRLFRSVTGYEEDRFPLVAPYGVVSNGSGRFWVADPGGAAVQGVDLVQGRVDYLRTTGSEALVSPAAVALDKGAGRLYVADSVLSKVFIFDLRGRHQGEVLAPGGFGRPTAMAVGRDGSLYVADGVKGLVLCFSREGKPAGSFGSGVNPGGKFLRPLGVTVDPEGNLYVLDGLGFRVEILTPDGRPRGIVGGIGDGPGRFARPRGLALDSQGHIYVSDAAFGNIQIFDSGGRLLLVFGGTGKDEGEFNLPAGLYIDDSDRIYVVDAYNHRVQIFQYLSRPD